MFNGLIIVNVVVMFFFIVEISEVLFKSNRGIINISSIFIGIIDINIIFMC